MSTLFIIVTESKTNARLHIDLDDISDIDSCTRFDGKADTIITCRNKTIYVSEEYHIVHDKIQSCLKWVKKSYDPG